MCCLAIVLAVAESQAGVAIAFPGHASGLAALLHGRRTLTAVESTLTFWVKDVEAEPGRAAPVIIRLPSSGELRAAGAGEGVFLLIRNIPKGVSFTAGMSTGRVWVVPLREASALRLICPGEVNTQFQLAFHLIGPNQRSLAQATVTVRPSQAVAALGPASPKHDPPKPPVQPRAQADPLLPRDEAVLLKRGRDVLEQGSVAAARLIFEELAMHGSAAGALALARSYDPAYLAASSTSAPGPDLAEARKWYERAAELGNQDARHRLVEIASGR
jgi:hypothetical protein